jgi:hypothetical protein
MNQVKSVRTTAYLRAWGYDNSGAATAQADRRLQDLLDRYHEVQDRNVVTELDVTRVALGTEKPFGELTPSEANRVAAHLLVRIALYTHFRDRLPDPPPDFAGEVDWLHEDRRLLDRVISRAGWDTAEYFMPPHPTE